MNVEVSFKYLSSMTNAGRSETFCWTQSELICRFGCQLFAAVSTLIQTKFI